MGVTHVETIIACTRKSTRYRTDMVNGPHGARYLARRKAVTVRPGAGVAGRVDRTSTKTRCRGDCTCYVLRRPTLPSKSSCGLWCGNGLAHSLARQQTETRGSNWQQSKVLPVLHARNMLLKQD